MNERIKELAIQAKLHSPLLLQHWGNVDALTDSERKELENIEKFAQLIIRECAELCRKQSLHYAEHNNQGSASSAADVCRILIESHFGIKNETTRYDR